MSLLVTRGDIIKELEDQILYHKRKNYHGSPEISDSAFDALENKLRKLDPENPVLYLVGSPESGKINHNPPMLSSQKATSVDEVVK